MPEVPEVPRRQIDTRSIIETDPFMNEDAISRREEAFAQIVSEVRSQVLATSPEEMARALCEALSIQILAYITSQTERTIHRWASGDIGDMSQESKRRLSAAYEVLQLIDRFEAPGVAQTWLIGREPQLDFKMPAQALREDQLEEALAAARHFVAVG